MLDLLINNKANLPDGGTGVDIAVQDGWIVEVTAGIAGAARETLEAAGAAAWRSSANRSASRRADGAVVERVQCQSVWWYPRRGAPR